MTRTAPGAPMNVPIGLPMAGASYVASWPRVPEPGDDARVSKIPIRSVSACDHTSSICPSVDCVASWMIDWRVALKNTGGGRAIAAKLGVPADANYTSEEFRQACEAGGTDG